MIFLGGATINLNRKELVRSAEQFDDRSSSNGHLSFQILSTRLFYQWREYGEKDTKRGLFGGVWVVECGFVNDKSTKYGVMVSCVIRISRED